MKCTHCGSSFLPTNTSGICPQCQSILASGPKPVAAYAPQQYGNQTWETQAGTGSQDTPWRQGQQRSSSQGEIPIQTPFPQPGQMWQSTPTPPPPMEVAAHISSGPSRVLNQHNSTPVRVPNQGSDTPQAASHRMAGMMYWTPTSGVRPQVPHTSNLGFIIAGLCVIVGALILIFVYFMALSLPTTHTTTAYTTTPMTTKNTLPSPAVATPTPKVAASPTTTGAFPGQQYIDSAQMASMINSNTAQPTQTTTTFKVNQKIYVTFNIHPGGKNGAVCLIWYLNKRMVTQFPLPVTANARAGYSYAIYGGTGSAYVEIYWASTTACTDKLLAQRVNFTVTK